MTATQNATGMHIEGRRTYHSVRIYQNGKEIAYVPRTYGYGNHFVQTAVEWLRSNGYIDTDKFVGEYYLTDTMGVSVSVIDVQRKRDL